MRRILVTGANKGIGLALVEAILAEHADTFVYVGSRDLARGRAAVAGLVREHAGWEPRLEVVEIDVADPDSVAAAGRHVRESLGRERLYGLVNNAGVGGHTHDLATVLATNTLGVQRVCETFVPLVEPVGGRVVNVTSAAGPSFVAECRLEWQRFFADERMTWPTLRNFVDECLAMAGDQAAFAAKGLADGAAYGLSKACANTYTLILARESPRLHVNACTPGFIETDLNRHYAVASGKSAAELGMKSPAEGAKAPLHLLFGALHGNGHYYGSDAKRSPLDRYRAPGTPEYVPPRSATVH
jgi:NAD(P)-dependent dehydrogenase (short-subunit alcohol dehydrogenase family)